MVGISSRKDAPAVTPDGPSIEQRLEVARQGAFQARQHLDSLTSRLRDAVEQQRFDDAHQIKSEIPNGEQAWAVAEAEVRALEGVIAHLEKERAAREAAEQAALRRHQAAGILAAAVETEKTLLDDLGAVKAEIIAGLGAIKDAVLRGQALEGQVRQQRSIQAQARVDSGEANSVPGHIAAPNMITVMVDQSQTLRALVREQITGF
jgi:hypothetical protein